MITGKDLVEKLYARRDYEGLSETQKAALTKERSKIAEELVGHRASGNNLKDVPKENLKEARNLVYDMSLKDAKRKAEKARENILKTVAEESKPGVEEVVEEVITTSPKGGENKTSVIRRAIKWSRKNKKPLLIAGTSLAALGTAAGVAMNNKDKNKK